MAVGYLAKSATNTEGMSYDALLYCKTNIAGYFFDGFIKVDATHKLNITSNPVETGASIVDHAYVLPANITMEVVMSDVHQSMVPGQFEGGWSRSKTSFEILQQLQRSRIPFSVLCRFGLYENMLIESIQGNDDSETYQALKATVNLVEIPLARVKEVEISKASQTTISTEMGKIQAVNLSTDEQAGFWVQVLGKDYIPSRSEG